MKWLGYGDDENTWVPAKWCDCDDKIMEFERANTELHDVEKILKKRSKNEEVIFAAD